MKEQILQFGEGRRLLGILSRPDTLVPGRPAVIIPNTGVEHRVGPNRLHVHLCRAFADAGFAALRMDLSGMGDSLPPASGAAADAVRDQVLAMDELQRIGVAQRFVALGLCSGGHDAHRVSVADARVVGGAYLDHYAYPTTKHGLVYGLQRISDPGRIRNFLARRFGAGPQSEKERFRGDQVEFFVKPPLAQFNADLDALMQRQLKLFFVYTGELQAVYNYADQLLDSCPKLRGYPAVDLHYWPEADHVFSHTHMRAQLIGTLTQWLKDRLG